MAVRLGEHVVWGMLDNRRKNRTVGFLHFWDTSRSLYFDLAGDCGPDVQGKRVRFWCREQPWDCAPLDEALLNNFHWHQVGAPGKMTVSGWVRAMPCNVEEFLQRKALGEPPPTPWVRHLYLEWYGQNGRVLVEMADPLVEQRPDTDEIDGRRLEPQEIWVPLPNLAMMPEAVLEDSPPSGLDITSISFQGGQSEQEHWTHVMRRQAMGHDEDALDSECEGDTDTWSEPDDTDEEEEEFFDENDFLEYLEQNSWDTTELRKGCGAGPEDSLLDLLDKPGPPPSDTLDDQAVEVHLKCLAMRLALFNIGIDICEHCSQRDAYRMLAHDLLPNISLPLQPEGKTGRVSSVRVRCHACRARKEARRNDTPSSEGSPGKDLPF